MFYDCIIHNNNNKFCRIYGFILETDAINDWEGKKEKAFSLFFLSWNSWKHNVR